MTLIEAAPIDPEVVSPLERGDERPLSTADLEQAVAGMRPSTLEWLATVRNYVEFANPRGRYDEVATFLVSREARAWKD